MPAPSSSDETLFADALKVTPAERAAFLQAACAGDTARQARIESLVRAHEAAPDFLATSTVAPVCVFGPGEQPGDRIGRYKLLQKIGEGGCGIVYMAEQEEPVRRRVALKVIKLGMDTKEVISRFEAERQALALMDHPNIAHVYDAGATSSGRPFFVMELVRGVPFTRFCDEQNLATAQRLELFIAVCHAVQHAHQKGIIHRDLKPSNILVTLHDGVPVPKVIDFGIAKAIHGRLTDRTLFTAFEQFIGTPAYMSPEQAEMSGLDIDIRSDIYALGVLLYELLIGRPPFDPQTLVKVGIDEIRRIIREVEPPRPSTRWRTLGESDRITVARQRGTAPAQLSTLLRGDLDWIVMKAMEKNRTRRYDSAGDLAADIRRHLQCEPVNACPPSSAYLLKKFLRRHHVVVGVGLALTLTVLIGAGVSLWQAARAQRSAELAERRRQEAETSRLVASQAQRRAEGAAQRISHQLARESVDKGVRLWEAGDPFGAFLWFSEALLLDAANPGAVAVHRLRLGALLRETPIPRRFLVHGGGYGSAEFSPDGRRVLLAGDKTGARIWDVQTAAPITPVLAQAKGAIWASYSPDGHRVLTASNDGTARLWSAADGTPVTPPFRHEAEVYFASFSADGRRVVTCGKDQTARIWDAATGRALTQPLRHEGSVWPAIFSPDGRLVLTASMDQTARLWDAATGKPTGVVMHHAGRMAWATFSPDGRFVATASEDRTARIWDAASGAPTTPPLVHEEEVTHVAFDPDGNRLVTASGESIWHLFDAKNRPGAARIWSAATGSPLTPPIPHAVGLLHAIFTPDGRRIATASRDGTVRLWDAQTAQLIMPALWHGTKEVFRVALAPDGRQLCSTGPDLTARVWDLEGTGRREVKLANSAGAGVFAFSADGRLIAGKYYVSSAQIWSAVTGVAIAPRVHKASIRSTQLSPDGRLLATAGADGSARLWDSRSGAEVTPPLAHTGSVAAVAFSSDGKRIATASADGSARVWSTATGAPVTPTLSHSSAVNAVDFDNQGRRVVTASEDKSACIWDATSGTRLTPPLLHDSGVSRAIFSPNGDGIATATVDGWVRIWEASTGTAITPPMRQSVRTEAGTNISAMKFSPDGMRLAVADGDGAARVWDTRTGQPATPILRHQGEVSSVCFSHDGRFVVTASRDHSARVWEVSTGQPVTPPLQHAGVVSTATFAADDRSIRTAGYTNEHGFVRNWEFALTERPAEELRTLAQVCAARRVDASGALVPLGREEISAAVQKLEQMPSR